MSPLSLKETKNRKDELYNDVVIVTHSMTLKFSKSEENILNIIKKLCNALWMIDGNHEKFNTALLKVFAVNYRNFSQTFTTSHSRNSRQMIF